MLRLPPELKDRIQSAAQDGNQSMNALIVSVLEKEFPHPTIDVHSLAMLLTGLANEADQDGDDGEMFKVVNSALAETKTPWTAKCDDGVVKFYPYASRSTVGQQDIDEHAQKKGKLPE